ncbi:hypothetical protein Esti_005475 [Eimeria stiedai]
MKASKGAAERSSAAAAGFRAAAVAVAAAASVAGYQLVCSFLSYLFPENAWGPGTGERLADKYKGPILVASALYLPAVYLLQRVMASRPAYSLQTAAFLWNLSLSMLSWIGVITALVHQPHMFLTAWFPERQFAPPVRVVITLFTLTKAVEFGDTFVLVLKKKPLTFLHVYHHLTVSLYCWHAQFVNADFAHAFALMNLGVHALMYLYFALSCCTSAAKPGTSSSSSSGRRLLHQVLRRCRPFITVLQIVQMLVGANLAFQATLQHHDASQVFNAQLAVCMYLSYAVLFMHLYCSSYLPHLSSNRLIALLLLHSFAAAGVYKLYTVSGVYGLVTQLAAAAAVSLSFSLFVASRKNSSNSSNSSKDKMLLALQLTTSLLLGAAQIIVKPHKEADGGAAAAAPKAAEAEREAKDTGPESEPSRCLSLTSTSADTSTLSSCVSSNEDFENLTSTPSSAESISPATTPTRAAAAAAERKQAASKEEGAVKSTQTGKAGRHKCGESLLQRLVTRERKLQVDWISVTAAVAAAAAPAVYGQLCCSDWALGLCVFDRSNQEGFVAAVLQQSSNSSNKDASELLQSKAAGRAWPAAVAAATRAHAAAGSLQKKMHERRRHCMHISSSSSKSGSCAAAAAAAAAPETPERQRRVQQEH